MSEINSFIAGVVTVLALILFIISYLAYQRVKSTRTLFISAAFLFFFIKGILLTASIFFESELYFMLSIVVDMFILLLLSFSVLKK